MSTFVSLINCLLQAAADMVKDAAKRTFDGQLELGRQLAEAEFNRQVAEQKVMGERMFQDQVEAGRQEAEKELRRRIREGRAVAEQNFTRLLAEGREEGERQYQNTIQEERAKAEITFQVRITYQSHHILMLMIPGS